jgi:hypothetical protein
MNARFEQALALIDAENAKDPNTELAEGQQVPRELLYSKRLTSWVLKLNPRASEILQLAARSQHISRWKVPRSAYPLTRAGYHQWKNELKNYHAQVTSSLLHLAGYDEPTISGVRALNLKQCFPHDPESRTLQDALCLTFLQFQFGELAQKSSPEKVMNALRKSWAKMTPQAQKAALALPFSAFEKELLQGALAPHQAILLSHSENSA